MKFKRILILGALPKDEEKRKLYEAIVSVCRKFAEEASSPIDTAEFEGTDAERYERAFREVGKADLIVGELSEPSTGQGMELRKATVLGKPVVVVAREGSRVSGLVKACPVVKKIIYYSNLEELESKLGAFIEGFK